MLRRTTDRYTFFLNFSRIFSTFGDIEEIRANGKPCIRFKVNHCLFDFFAY